MLALDCCAGVGGLSLGLAAAGFSVRGVEIDDTAAQVHRRNVGPCTCMNLWDYVPHQSFDLVAGGVPCQSHSVTGRRLGTCEERGQLYVPLLRIARRARARGVLIENVRGLLSAPSPTHATAFDEVVAAMRGAGFEHVEHAVLDAADFGVPQRRHRVFVVGFEHRTDWACFDWPRPTHAEHPQGALRPWVAAGAALGVPAAGGALARPAPCVSATEGRSELRPNSKGGAHRARRCGDVLNTALREATGRQERLTPEECALLQGFPPGFALEGTRSQRYRQAGNAVPPALAAAVARCVFAAIV